MESIIDIQVFLKDSPILFFPFFFLFHNKNVISWFYYLFKICTLDFLRSPWKFFFHPNLKSCDFSFLTSLLKYFYIRGK